MTLISQTLYDIRYFILILFATQSFFGSAMYMIQLSNKADAAEDESVIKSVFGFAPLDAFINIFLLSLGEFQMDGFDSHPQY